MPLTENQFEEVVGPFVANGLWEAVMLFRAFGEPFGFLIANLIAFAAAKDRVPEALKLLRVYRRELSQDMEPRTWTKDEQRWVIAKSREIAQKILEA